MKIISLDLEFNQPSGKIIEIGAVAGDLVNGEVVSLFESLVALDEDLLPRITTLTGISPEMLFDAPNLADAGAAFLTWSASFKEFPNLMTWGGGDSEQLKQQLGSNFKWPFGFRYLDVKTVFIAHQQSKGHWMPRGGLAKSMTKLGLSFQGQKHRALCDAYNTFALYYNLLRSLRGESCSATKAPIEILRPRLLKQI
jgi:inhibitor of KinA sporulation pathway (predicted exonuclease)